MNGREFDRPAMWLRPVMEPDGIGGERFAGWDDRGAIWCKGHHLLDGVRFGQDQLRAVNPARFATRFRSDLRPTDALRFEGAVWQITHIKELDGAGRRRVTEITGTAQTDGAG